MSPPRIVAKLDLSKETERDTQSFIKRACTGRWPMWRLLGMRRKGRTLYAAVEWVRNEPVVYTLVNIALDKCAMNWRYFPTAAAALAALDAKRQPPTAPAAPAAASERSAHHGR
jgi:hypothetical protein